MKATMEKFLALREDQSLSHLPDEVLASLVVAESIHDLQRALEAAAQATAIGNRYQRQAFRDLGRAVQEAVNANDDWQPI